MSATLTTAIAAIVDNCIVDACVATARRGFELYLGNADVRAFLALALNRAGEHREAAEHFRAAMSLNPFYPIWYRNGLARALLLMSEFDEALVLVEENLNIEPTHIHSWFQKAYLLGQIGRSNVAEDAVREVRRLAPDLRLDHIPELLMINDEALSQRIIAGLRDAGLPG